MHAPKAGRLVAPIALAVAVAAAGVARADQHTVKVAEKEKIGSYLTDAKGMTLYVFEKDSPGKSACSGPCVQKWPLFQVEKVGASAPLKEADFGTITRDDGKKQTTYKGMPLYYYVGDKAPSDTTGQGLGNVWFVAKP